MKSKRHTITRQELNTHTVEQLIAGSAGGGNVTKQLYFIYDIGRKRLGYEVRFVNDGPRRVQWFDDLDQAIEEYNEI